MIGPTTVVSLLIISVAFSIYYFLRSRHIERMARIDKGLTDKDPVARRMFMEIKLGMLATGVGLGLFTAYFLQHLLPMSDVLYPALMLMFGGIALVLSYFVSNRLDQQ